MKTNKPAIQALVDICKAHQLKHIVISPGSRNAPLTVAFNNDVFFKTYAIVDERSAGFFALGIAQKTSLATVLVCTSGSAALNYSPAVAEAFYQQVPLLILTADRPVEWIDQGIGQSMNQSNLYENFVLQSFTLPQEANTEQAIWYSNRLVNEAILRTASATNKGPVHINIPLKEPLYGEAVNIDYQPNIIKQTNTNTQLTEKEVSHLQNIWQESSNILIVVGMLSYDKLINNLLNTLLEKHANVALLSETNSNLSGAKLITCIDRTIGIIDSPVAFKPDLLITLGHSVISKRIKKMLQAVDIPHHWHVSTRAKVIDTYKSLTKLITCSIPHFVKHLLDFNFNSTSSYQSDWLDAAEKARQKHLKYMEKIEFSDLQAFSVILPKIPNHSILQMGNSASVRYCQLFNIRADLQYYANRGVSGIDGCSSTAVGYASVTEKPVTLITGDIAFLYDVNALWNNYISPHLRIIIINNAGGGIFRIINGPSSTNELEQFFETTHRTSADHVAQTYGLAYFTANDANSLQLKLDELYQCDQAAILEVFTPRLKNDVILKAYFDWIGKEGILNY